MKNTLSIILLFILLVLNGYGDESQKPDLFSSISQLDNTFTSKEGRFSVTPPNGFNSFTYGTSNNSTPAGQITMHQYLMSLERGSCMMAYYDLPESLFQRKSAQQILTDGRNQAVRNMKATLKKEEAITVDGYPGLSFLMEVPDDENTVYVRAGLVIAQPRAYNYLYLALNESELNKNDVKNYFKSFRVIK